VAAVDTTTSVGYVFTFSTANGTLAPLNGGVPVAAGVQPSAITVDPSGSYLYVTDANRNDILAWSVSSGALTPLGGSPFAAGNSPSAIVIDSTGKFAYVTNAQDSNVTGYLLSGGQLSRIATYATDTQPVAVGIDPALNQYLYTVNFLSNTVSGFSITSPSGALLNSQNSPYAANANPTAVAAIPHGTVTK
jgi:DNA-binding beta-propeller fold protein YncE